MAVDAEAKDIGAEARSGPRDHGAADPAADGNVTTGEAASTELLIDTVGESPFYIPATGPSTRPRKTLKHGDTFAVFDSHGDIGASGGGPDGLFHHDTRYLSRLELMINGAHPLLLGANLRDDNLSLTVDLTNPDIYFEERVVLPKDSIHVVRTVLLWDGTAHVRLAIRNHWNRPVRLGLSLTFGSDFADVFEVRGTRRDHHGEVTSEVTGDNEVTIACAGLDGITRRTTLIFDPQPESLYSSAASYRLTVAPGETRSIFMQAACESRGRAPKPFVNAMLAARRQHRLDNRGLATVETSNEVLNEVLCRSMADLSMLVTETPQGPFPYAGIPWYSTTFGRDGIITAIETLWIAPGLSRGVLRRLAYLQATGTDVVRDAEPGKIIHEMRDGEMANLHEVPFGRYYGSIDSTPLFLVLLGLYVERTGDVETLRELWPHAELALAWIDRYGDRDGDGFVEYARATEQGLHNQGWKDSHDAVFHADGRLAEGPIALAEVQAYVYLAKSLSAHALHHLGEPERARALHQEADELARRFEEQFWCPEIGTYAIALDGDKRPCAVRSSNAGQVLWSGMISPERAEQVARGLMRPEFHSGWGLRTIAEGEARYNPMSYHNGSVWPHDNALIAYGLARYGFGDAVGRIFKGIFDAASYMDLRRLPELYCGFRRRTGRGPTLYPVACSPQAWACGTPFALIQASLGLQLKPEAGEIVLNNPSLPPFLDWIGLRNLTVGDVKADILVRRLGRSVSVDLVGTDGDARLTVQMTREGRRPGRA
jgi:glycogen debranching enzyme